jgi:hypothetical protein
MDDRPGREPRVPNREPFHRACLSRVDLDRWYFSSPRPRVQHDAPLVVVLVTEPAGDAFDLLDDAVATLGPGVGVAKIEKPSISGHHLSIVTASRVATGMSASTQAARNRVRRAEVSCRLYPFGPWACSI